MSSCPRRLAARVAHAAPEVDDLAPTVVGGAGRAELLALREVALELVADALEARVDVSLHHGLRLTRSAAGPCPLSPTLQSSPASAWPCAKPACCTSSRRRGFIRFVPIASAAWRSGDTLRTLRAARARARAPRAAAAARETGPSAPKGDDRVGRSDPVGFRHSTRAPRSTGPRPCSSGSTRRRRRRCGRRSRPGGTSRGSRTTPRPPGATVACGASGAPNITRRPLSSSTAAISRRPSNVTPLLSTWRPRSASEWRPGGTRPSASRRTERAAARRRRAAARARAVRRPRRRRAGPLRPPAAVRRRCRRSPSPAPSGAAGRSPRRERGVRPAASVAATIDPADVPTNVPASRSVDAGRLLEARPARASIHASPRMPPPPSTSTSGARSGAPRPSRPPAMRLPQRTGSSSRP